MFHIILGLIFGLLAFYVLVLPAVENRLNRQRDDELMVYMQKLNSANQENDILAQENAFTIRRFSASARPVFCFTMDI